jgi:hypothetical protein
MLKSDFYALCMWGVNVRQMFNGEMPYLVGSALRTKDYRDVDVRLIVTDEVATSFDALLKRTWLDMAVSMWGQRATGLPIDFQIQSMTEANVPEHGVRNAIGIERPL